MAESNDDPRLEELVNLVLDVAAGNYGSRVAPSDTGDTIDAVGVGLNLIAESLELERSRRKRAEALLRDEVHAYEQAPAMFCSIELADFEIVKCNETLATALQLPKESLLRRRFIGFVPADERLAAEAALIAISQQRAPEQTAFHLEPQEGNRIPVLLSGTLADEKGTRVRVILRDTSIEQSLEAQLRQAQKLEAVGRLASGVAHDFNNILAVILGSASLLERVLPGGHQGMRELDAIMSAAENGTGLTGQLLALSKPIPNAPASSVNLNQCIRDAERLLLQSLGPSNELVMTLAQEDLFVCIDPSELVQILLNLTVNARDAMPSGGQLSIRTSRSTDDKDAGLATLEVLDTGGGMDQNTLDQVMEPFFTTKGASGGSGLGLAICARVVQKWQGDLTLSSKPGEGTRVTVAMPLVATGAALRVDERVEGAIADKGCRVLVVDDDPLVRNVLVCTLEADGYEVLSADGMVMALELARGVESLDLLITDVMMPGASGTELADAIWKTRPGLPVLFISGYTGDRVGSELMSRDNVRFVGKPFHRDKLLALVTELGRPLVSA